jgi:hypothetical protein
MHPMTSQVRAVDAGKQLQRSTLTVLARKASTTTKDASVRNHHHQRAPVPSQGGQAAVVGQLLDVLAVAARRKAEA